MKLKTLKNLNKEKDGVYYSRKLSYNPLIHHKRTDHLYKWVNDILDLKDKELKAEALKRAKSLKRQLDKTKGKSEYWMCLGELREVIRFNNLTSEDLQ